MSLNNKVSFDKKKVKSMSPIITLLTCHTTRNPWLLFLANLKCIWPHLPFGNLKIYYYYYYHRKITMANHYRANNIVADQTALKGLKFFFFLNLINLPLISFYLLLTYKNTHNKVNDWYKTGNVVHIHLLRQLLRLCCLLKCILNKKNLLWQI